MTFEFAQLEPHRRPIEDYERFAIPTTKTKQQARND